MVTTEQQDQRGLQVVRDQPEAQALQVARVRQVQQELLLDLGLLLQAQGLLLSHRVVLIPLKSLHLQFRLVQPDLPVPQEAQDLRDQPAPPVVMVAMVEQDPQEAPAQQDLRVPPVLPDRQEAQEAQVRKGLLVVLHSSMIFQLQPLPETRQQEG